jgi:exocyst complex component 7
MSPNLVNLLSNNKCRPRRVGIPEYVASLERTERALRGLRASNLSANQSAMKEMTALVNYGTRQLEEVFKQDVVNCTGNQIEPLHFITKGSIPLVLFVFMANNIAR